MVFFFKDTATTEIYTYGHALSLHDALPISSVDSEYRVVNVFWFAVGPGLWWSLRAPSERSGTTVALLALASAGGLPRLLSRSEEHTSELQSLMRISYAVFCLKKKK